MIIKLCCDETFYKSTQQSNEKELLQKKKIVLLTNDCVLASRTLCFCIWTISALCAFPSSYVSVHALRRFANNLKIWRSRAEITSAHVIDHPWSVKNDIALVALLFKALEKSILHLVALEYFFLDNRLSCCKDIRPVWVAFKISGRRGMNQAAPVQYNVGDRT